jgi:hypothetical protein
MKFLEADELNSDPSNWWIPDTECVLGMLRAAGFRNFSRPAIRRRVACWSWRPRTRALASTDGRSVERANDQTDA